MAIFIMAHIKPYPEKEEDVLRIGSEFRSETHAHDTGFQLYEFIKTNDEVYPYAFIESWDNQASLDVHNTSEHFQRLIKELQTVAEVNLVLGTEV